MNCIIIFTQFCNTEFIRNSSTKKTQTLHCIRILIRYCTVLYYCILYCAIDWWRHSICLTSTISLKTTKTWLTRFWMPKLGIYTILFLYCTVRCPSFGYCRLGAPFFHQDNGLELRPYSDSSQEKKLRYAFKVMVKHTVLPVEI